MGRPRKIRVNPVESVGSGITGNPVLFEEVNIADQTRRISDLNDKFTPLIAQKAIANHISNHGTCFESLEKVLKTNKLSNDILRSIYIPISLHGLKCDEKYLKPILDSEIRKLSKLNKLETMDREAKNTVNIVDEKPKEKIEKEIIDGALATFESFFDDIISGKEVDSTKIAHLFTLPQSKELVAYVEKRKETFEEDYDCFPEYYSNIPKRMFNKILKMMDEILEPTSNARKLVQEKKKRTTPRVAKPRNILKAVENFKYAQVFEDRKSLHPSKIEGSKIVFLYDIQTKKMIRMQSQVGTTLSIKGTTIYNVDMNSSKSFRKNIRNPDIFKQMLHKLNACKEYDDFLKVIHSKNLELTTTRTNDHMIILSAF